MSPEYAVHGRFSVKSDVFSFGVLVLEIVSGKRNSGFSRGDQHLNLLGHAWTLYKEGRSLELVDAYLCDSANLPEVQRLIHVGLLCVQQRPDDRPSMTTVIAMLSNEGMLPQANQPGFFTEGDVFVIEALFFSFIKEEVIFLAIPFCAVLLSPFLATLFTLESDFFNECSLICGHKRICDPN
ncbi:G-type lectin S-receptor-like serine/threonine-protein kinase SD1-1 [Forsythia ovata]|uniref:G-type lectin S-receptor-like serine/threonine-protein kinase SD1-1 n=1 Tax=Forsythia ovata TaxID=205694 RepID=A0ABD1S659_9LAMI